MSQLRISLAAFALLAAASGGCTVNATTSPPDIPPSCSPDSTVTGCSSPSTGFSCTGSDTPDESDPSLACSVGVAGNANSTLFCCLSGVTFSSSSCAPDPTVANCLPANGAPSYGFSCTSTDTPDQTDPSLNCSQGVPGNAGATLFCCQ